MSLLDVLGAESINPLSIDIQSLMHVLYDCGEDIEYITTLQSIYVEVNHNCLTNEDLLSCLNDNMIHLQALYFDKYEGFEMKTIKEFKCKANGVFRCSKKAYEKEQNGFYKVIVVKELRRSAIEDVKECQNKIIKLREKYKTGNDINNYVIKIAWEEAKIEYILEKFNLTEDD